MLSMMGLQVILLYISIMFSMDNAYKSKTYIKQLLYQRYDTAIHVNIRKATDNDIPLIAKFLANSMYPLEMPQGQRRELIRLEQNDLVDRYGSLVGKRRYPSTMILAEEDEDIVGCVGLDCQIYNESMGKFSKLRYNTKIDEDYDIVALVVANLAVRIDRRKNGIAKLLLKACDEYMKEVDFNSIYLLVDSENIAARKLYTSNGYKEIFQDLNATCVSTGSYSLITKPCINICYQKTLKNISTNRINDVLNQIFSIFKK